MKLPVTLAAAAASALAVATGAFAAASLTLTTGTAPTFALTLTGADQTTTYTLPFTIAQLESVLDGVLALVS